MSAQHWVGVYQELAAQFPRIAAKLIDPDGNPAGWFELFRDEDGECLRYFPDTVIGEDERLVLVYAVGGTSG